MQVFRTSCPTDNGSNILIISYRYKKKRKKSECAKLLYTTLVKLVQFEHFCFVLFVVVVNKTMKYTNYPKSVILELYIIVFIIIYIIL